MVLNYKVSTEGTANVEQEVRTENAGEGEETKNSHRKKNLNLHKKKSLNKIQLRMNRKKLIKKLQTVLRKKLMKNMQMWKTKR